MRPAADYFSPAVNWQVDLNSGFLSRVRSPKGQGRRRNVAYRDILEDQNLRLGKRFIIRCATQVLKSCLYPARSKVLT